MNEPKTTYENPLIARYAGKEIAEIWSPQRKFTTWRSLWIALAEAQRELGLDISPEQIDQLREHKSEIDWDRVAELEATLRHDVMAHVYHYGELCPDARPIIHLGATSCFVTDNTDLLLIRESLQFVKKRLLDVIDKLACFAKEYAELPCLGFTHFQPAQLTTVGKRATLWCYDLVLDLEEVRHRLSTLKFRGVKGTTGTQATFLELFGGDAEKVRQLDELVSAKMWFPENIPVTGQTYSRKIDSQALDSLSGIAQSAHKFATDLRLLAHRKEIEEPFEDNQIGSSAMAYKRNPMRAERICALARYVMCLPQNASQTHATQWLERTLDDSANRRLSLPQAFLAVDAILKIYSNVVGGLVVYPGSVQRNLMAELPFMATERILMRGVAAGGDRQDLHERIRQHSMEAATQVKVHGEQNDLIERLKSDPLFKDVDLDSLLNPSEFIGCAPAQVCHFLETVIEPLKEDMTEDRLSDDLSV